MRTRRAKLKSEVCLVMLKCEVCLVMWTEEPPGRCWCCGGPGVRTRNPLSRDADSCEDDDYLW